MIKNITIIKEFLFDLLFPKFCLNCQKEKNYLCQDCQGLLEFSKLQYCLCQKPKPVFKQGKCEKCKSKKLDGLYFALSFQNFLVKKIIHSYKYPPFIKDLSKILAALIITHFQFLEKTPDFLKNPRDFILIPVPVSNNRLKWRNFNPAEEIGKELSRILEIPLVARYLIKTKETLSQTELSNEQRKENIKDAFSVLKTEANKLANKKILLIDDVYTTGSTLEECSRVLKQAGNKEVLGIVIARD